MWKLACGDRERRVMGQWLGEGWQTRQRSQGQSVAFWRWGMVEDMSPHNVATATTTTTATATAATTTTTATTTSTITWGICGLLVKELDW